MNQQNTNNCLDTTQTDVKRPFIISIMHKLVPFSMIWVSLVLMYGVICMYTNTVGQDEFYRFIFFLSSPFVVVLNCIALFISVYHSMVWFNLIPKALPCTIFNKKSNTLLLIAGLWMVMLTVSIFLFLFVLK